MGVGGHDDGCGKGSVDDERTGGAVSAFFSSDILFELSSSFSDGAGLGVVEGLLPPDDAEPDVEDADPRRVFVHNKTLRYT